MLRALLGALAGLVLLAGPAHASGAPGAASPDGANPLHTPPAGYSLLTDAAGIACIDKPGVGGMGIHYVNSTLVSDDHVDAATPELLVYEPKPGGRLRLVAAEYVVFQAAWDAKHTSPPRLFGQELELVGEPNRYGLPPFYELHAWLFKHNPLGLFADYNPKVVCPAA